MPNWIVYGIIAAVCFGVTNVLFKVAQQKGNLSPYYLSFLIALGAVIVSGLFLAFNPSFQFELKSNSLALAAGIVWAVGMILVAVAIAQKADISRLSPIFNANTLVTVLLGIIFLKELPDVSQMFRVVAGAVLIVIGAVLVSV